MKQAPWRLRVNDSLESLTLLMAVNYRNYQHWYPVLINPRESRVGFYRKRFVRYPQDVSEYHGIPLLRNLDEDRIVFPVPLGIFDCFSVVFT